jgi:hypothetical protein
MRNSIHVTSDLRSIILIDTQQEDQRSTLGRRGVLLSVLGTNICATDVAPELDDTLAKALRTAKKFYEFPATESEKNQLSITYNEMTNTVFIIGVTDIIVGFGAPEVIPSDKIKAIGVKLKASPGSNLVARHVLLVRLEGDRLENRMIAFYLIDTAQVPA